MRSSSTLGAYTVLRNVELVAQPQGLQLKRRMSLRGRPRVAIDNSDLHRHRTADGRAAVSTPDLPWRPCPYIGEASR
jgi:hypothetical protein